MTFQQNQERNIDIARTLFNLGKKHKKEGVTEWELFPLVAENKKDDAATHIWRNL